MTILPEGFWSLVSSGFLKVKIQKCKRFGMCYGLSKLVCKNQKVQLVIVYRLLVFSCFGIKKNSLLKNKIVVGKVNFC